MTKKDYELIAKAIKRAKPEKNEIISMTEWYKVIREIGYSLLEDNEKFPALKFREACGVAE